MRKIKLMIITLSALFICMQGNAQSFWEWGDHFALSDSTSDNANPFLFRTPYNNSEALFMVWEKAFDSLSSEIWMDNILDTETPIAVLASPGVHYTNPKIMSARYYPYPDSLFYLFYETNENGNKDIYYMVFLPDGSFMDPVAFANNPTDDNQLSFGGEFYGFDASTIRLNNLCWINNGNLNSRFLARDSTNKHYFTLPQIIDSSNCSNPIANEYEVLYLRFDSSGSHLYECYIDNTGVWSSPEVYYDSTNCANPTRTQYYSDPCWTTYIDSSWRIMINGWGGNELYDISSPTPFDPAVIGFVIGVKSWFPDVWVAVAYPENNVDEIFMTEWAGSNDFINFSNSGTMNRNPKFFSGESYSYSCWFDYIVWESYRNGHWQIWASKMIQCAGDIKEESNSDAFISAYPNPFSQETIIRFSLSTRSDVSLDIYSNQGKFISRIANQSFDQGDHQLRWNANDLPAGMYIIKMMVGGKMYSSKVVKQH